MNNYNTKNTMRIGLGFTISIEKIIKITKRNHKLLKSKRWMPWLSEAMKDAISCDKLRGVAHEL